MYLHVYIYRRKCLKENTAKCLQQLSKNGGILGDFNFIVLLFYHFHTINMDILLNKNRKGSSTTSNSQQ